MGSQDERSPIVYVTAPYIPVKLLFNISTSNKPNILNQCHLVKNSQFDNNSANYTDISKSLLNYY